MDFAVRYLMMPSFMLFAIWGLVVSLRELWRDFREGGTDEVMQGLSRSVLRSGRRW